MPKKNQVDFFGGGKTLNYLNGKSNTSFLGPGKPGKKGKKLKNNSKIKPINFLNGGKPMYPINNSRPKNKYMNWNYKQIKKKFPGINPWGDADMDGSPNLHDCKPFNVGKDAKVIETIKGIFSRKEKPFRVETKEERTLREVGAKIKTAKRKQRLKAFVSGPPAPRPISAALTKKVKGKIVIRKPIVAEKLVKGAVTLAGVPAAFPRAKGKSRKGESVRASAGRPKGPSGKFVIPGRGAVYEKEWRKYVSQQKEIARLKEKARIKALREGKGVPADSEQFEAAPVEGLPTEQFEEVAPVQVVQQRPSQQFQQAQVLSQAPRPAQGVPRETLDFSRGGVLTPQGGNILNAPNVARGELRGVGEVSVVKLGERPQTNPRGELFTQIDPVTGKSIVHRRITEKFATGEAL